MDYTSESMIQFRGVNLLRLTEVMRINLPPYLLDQLKIKPEEIYRDIVLHIEREFVGERRQDYIPVSFKSPLNWWNHLKLEKFPDFFLKYFPVKWKEETKRVEVNRLFEFPDAYIPQDRQLGRFFVRDNHAHGFEF